jgi:GNAT superfamily N-acetyltransferase
LPPVADLTLRRSVPEDRDAIIDLLAASLGFPRDDPFFNDFFTWKHEGSPFGASPGWVACDRSRIAGFRTFARWEFEHRDGRVRRAVRAVDTATHPAYQGMGIFTRLTEHALAELCDDGIEFVFNTPNSKSRPGYLKMGWHIVGQLPTAVRPVRLTSLAKVARSRTAAERWSAPTSAGRPASEVLDDDRVSELLARRRATGLATRRTPEYLRWRFGFAPLHYRAVTLGDDPREGLAIFRLRRRGSALEAACCELLVPDGDRGGVGRLERLVARSCGADYVIRLGGAVADRGGFVRLPKQGPTLTWRGVIAANDAAPALHTWDLQLGDIELF